MLLIWRSQENNKFIMGGGKCILRKVYNVSLLWPKKNLHMDYIQNLAGGTLDYALRMLVDPGSSVVPQSWSLSFTVLLSSDTSRMFHCFSVALLTTEPYSPLE